MKNIRLWAVSLILVVFTGLSGCTSGGDNTGVPQSERPKISYDPLQSAGDATPALTYGELMCENDFLELYYQSETAAVSVFDKRSGEWWHSNPVDDSKLSASASSQLSVDTISSQGIAAHYNTYTDSLARKQITTKYIKNGIKVTYAFGNIGPDLSLIPQRLTNDRYQALLERADESGKKLFARRYTYNKDTEIWSLRSNITEDMAKNLKKLFESIDYTKDELAKDNSKTGASAAAQEAGGFEIPVTYILEGDSLLVKIIEKEIRYPKKELITSLNILEYFGALDKDSDGYLFVPDGSGAIISTGQAKGNAGYFQAPVYGRDNTISAENNINRQYNVLLPVFGINRDKSGVLAVLEDNEANAFINASKAGHADDFVTVSPSFALNTTENVGLSGDAVSKFYITSKSRYKGDTVVRYIFLTEEYSKYSGMAVLYRDYLTKAGRISENSLEGNIPFFLETTGAVESETSTLGIVHETYIPLTKYTDNIKIIEALTKDGVKNINLILTGWMNGGKDQKLAKNLELMRVLGGGRGFSELIAEHKAVGIYPQVLLNTMSERDSLTAKNKYTSRTLASKKSKLEAYDIVMGTALSGKGRLIVSPSKQKKLSARWLDALMKYTKSGAAFGDISSTVYSDYNEEVEFLRQYSALQSEEIIKSASQRLDSVLLTAPNALTAGYADAFIDVPPSSSSFTAAEGSVPFYQIVYHGSSDYSFEALNYTTQMRRSLLQCVEYGACPKFSFVYNVDNRLDYSSKAELYAAEFEQWHQAAAEAYKYLNERLEPVRGAKIIKHEMLAEGVYKTSYENGFNLIVNYNSEAVAIGGTRVEGMDSIVTEFKK